MEITAKDFLFLFDCVESDGVVDIDFGKVIDCPMLKNDDEQPNYHYSDYTYTCSWPGIGGSKIGEVTVEKCHADFQISKCNFDEVLLDLASRCGMESQAIDLSSFNDSTVWVEVQITEGNRTTVEYHKQEVTTQSPEAARIARDLRDT